MLTNRRYLLSQYMTFEVPSNYKDKGKKDCVIWIVAITEIMLISQYLKKSPLQVTWFSVSEGSTEEDAIRAIKADFEDKFPRVTVELVAILDDDYVDKIKNAASNGELSNFILKYRH